jgi:N-acetylmuramoyl-L-alanine amidase
MSARNQLTARPSERVSDRTLERNALAAALARHAPRGAVRVAEALAATALNRRRRAERLWSGTLAVALPGVEALFMELPEQPISTCADAAWNAACRRIAARALAGAGPDPALGAHCVLAAGAEVPLHAPTMTARIGPYAFYRDAGTG